MEEVYAAVEKNRAKKGEKDAGIIVLIHREEEKKGGR